MSGKTYGLIEPEEAYRVLEAKGAGQLVDVREDFEVDALRVQGALHLPLSRLEEKTGLIDKAAPVYLLCRSGSRAATAAARLHALGHTEIFVVRGGLDSWTAAGMPVVRGESRVWSMERQVRFAAGALVLSGVVLGTAVHRNWFFLSGFVGAGLVFSAVTDTCAMALVLARLPWNRGSCGK